MKWSWGVDPFTSKNKSRLDTKKKKKVRDPLLAFSQYFKCAHSTLLKKYTDCLNL
jgi:hypothetical protein